MASNGVAVGETGTGLIVSFGEMLIDFVPTESGVSLAEAPGFLKAPGGAPANVAIAVTRLGGKAAFVGKLGDDEFGHMLAGILRQYGVVDKGINFDKGARTALAFVTLRADGDREFMFYRNPSADMLLTPDELNLDLIRSVRFSLSLCFFFFFFGWMEKSEG
jgi:fructokinase